MPRKSDTLSAAEARRIALAAQGFGQARPAAAPGAAQMMRMIRRVNLLQIDSVNVLARAHYLPLFSRLGPYSTRLLDDLAYRGRRRTLFEYWAHMASLSPVEHYPLMRWRMEQAAKRRKYRTLAPYSRKGREFLAAVLAELGERGPLGAAELSGAGRASGSWWGWSKGKVALEWLFWTGQVTTHTRRGSFERVYGLTEQTLPRAALEAPAPSMEEAQRELIRLSARAHGVATERDLRDYFRLLPAYSHPRVAELVEAGELIPVKVEGWDKTAYLDPSARIPRRIDAAALLSPFDPVVWERQRTERLFDFHYRIEIYTPAHKRLYGYYTLPFLLGDRLVARADLKADRATSRLQVQGLHVEKWTDLKTIVAPLAAELRRLAGWLGLERIDVAQRGELALLRDVLQSNGQGGGDGNGRTMDPAGDGGGGAGDRGRLEPVV